MHVHTESNHRPCSLKLFKTVLMLTKCIYKKELLNIAGLDIIWKNVYFLGAFVGDRSFN
jgi:hypothetical protein